MMKHTSAIQNPAMAKRIQSTICINYFLRRRSLPMLRHENGGVRKSLMQETLEDLRIVEHHSLDLPSM